MEAVKYFLDFFFNWSVPGAWWHFILLAFLCWLLGSPCNVTVNDGRTGDKSEGETSSNN